MATYRFGGGNPSVPTLMTEKGHRRTDPPKRGKLSPPVVSAPPLTRPLAVPPLNLPAMPAETVTPPIAPAHMAMDAQRRNRGTVAAARQTIMDSGVLEILIDYVMNRVELSPGQVSAAMWLGKKIVPDLANASLPPESDDDEAEVGPSLIEFRIVDPQR